MVRTFQLTKALSKLTVLENMRLGAQGQRGENFFNSLFPGLWRGQEEEITARAEELLERFKLAAKREDFAGSLSGGQRKLLEMARALMVGPEMVMLDEPMAGVNPALTQSLLGHVKDLREQGMTLELTSKAKTLLVREGYNPAYGARPLRRTVQRMVETPLSRALLKGEYKAGTTIVVDVENGKLTFGRREVLELGQKKPAEPLGA